MLVKKDIRITNLIKGDVKNDVKNLAKTNRKTPVPESLF